MLEGAVAEPAVEEDHGGRVGVGRRRGTQMLKLVGAIGFKTVDPAAT
jgi:hypothetical protein